MPVKLGTCAAFMTAAFMANGLLYFTLMTAITESPVLSTTLREKEKNIVK